MDIANMENSNLGGSHECFFFGDFRFWFGDF